jgi:imidazole glycerol-phosphate synthase subunit HisF
MLTKRIIPCLDVKDGLVVKGRNFLDLKYAGDPVEMARRYYLAGADELVFLDITASMENRKTLKEIVKRVAKQIFIPFTVGGGINCMEDIDELLKCGADKVSINTAAIDNPFLIRKAVEKFGRQCIVIAIDAKKVGNEWRVFKKAGTVDTGLNVIEWAKKVEVLGAGEILLTSMDQDGTKNGYDIELTQNVSSTVGIPVIASGGAGGLNSIFQVLDKGKADAVLAASIFHYNKYTISQVKRYLRERNIEVR